MDTSEYCTGDVVWVKLQGCWWPGQIQDKEHRPINTRERKPPLAIVKFFQEEQLEFVKNLNMIEKYSCPKKNDYIKKGLNLYRAKHSHMEKFPGDVKTAETLTGGNPDICDDKMFAPEQKTSYAGLFGSPATNSAQKKGAGGKRGRASATPTKVTPPKKTTPRTIQKYLKGNSDYKAHILVQESKGDSESAPNESSFNDPDFISKDKLVTTPVSNQSKPSSTISTPQSAENCYTCHSCNFTTSRMNVMILHNKSHTTDTPQPKTKAKSKPTPSKPPKKETAEKKGREPKTTPTKPKQIRGRGRKLKTDEAPTPSKVPKIVPSPKPKQKRKEIEKPKTDVEIKNSLLADWSEDSNDEAPDVFDSLKPSENQNSVTNDISDKIEDVSEKKEAEVSQSPPILEKKLEKQVSCFDFDEDEDLSIETIGKKMPSLSKNEEKKSPLEPKVTNNEKSPKKSISEDNDLKTDDLDSEIRNLLEETSVPDLPNMPNQLKFTENFQSTRAIKFPDKENEIEEKPPAKSIFKTKTFFRSRHSRSQDAIEKYIADNTSNTRSLIHDDFAEEQKSEYDSTNEYSVTEDIRDSPNIEEQSPIDVKSPVKMAPKIELKKMKAALSDKLQNPVGELGSESFSPKANHKFTYRGKRKSGEQSQHESVSSEETNSEVSVKTDLFINNLSKVAESDPLPSTAMKQAILETNINEIEHSKKTVPEPVCKPITTEVEIKEDIKPPQSSVVPTKGKEKILNFDIDHGSTDPIEQTIVLKRTEQFESKSKHFKSSFTCKADEKWKNSETFTIEGSTEKIQKKILNKDLTSQSDIKSEPSPKTIILSDGTIIAKHDNSVNTTTSEIKTAIPVTSNLTSTTFVKSNIQLVKSSSPNILSKSKGKTVKHLVVVDSNGAKKKLILPKDVQDMPLLQAANIVKQSGTVSSNNAEKFLIVSSDSNNHASLPLGKRQPTLVKSPGKTQILLNTSEQIQPKTLTKIIQNKPAGDNGTLLLITNTNKQTKYILAPDQQKILIPTKPNMGQTIITSKGTVLSQQHTIKGKAGLSQTILTNKGQIVSQISGNTLITSTGQIIPTQSKISTTTSHTRTILTAKSNPTAIITSKGQLITDSTLLTSPNKNIIAKSPSGQQFKLISKIQSSKDPQNIILQQPTTAKQLILKNTNKVGGNQIPKVMEQTILLPSNRSTIVTMTAAQFEQLKKGGQIFFQNEEKAPQLKTVQKFPQAKYLSPGDKLKQSYSASSQISPPPLAMVKNEGASPAKRAKYQSETSLKSDIASSKAVNVSTKSLVSSSLHFSDSLDMQNLDELIPATTITTRKIDQHGNPLGQNQFTQEIPQLKQVEPAPLTLPNANQDVLAAAASNSLGEGLLAVPGENFGGPPNSFYLCVEENGTFTPINDQPLVLEDNQLVPMVTKPETVQHLPIVEEKPIENQQLILPAEQPPETNILINYGNQQILIDQQTLLSLSSGEGQQLVTSDGQLLLQGQLQQILTALASNPEIAQMMTSNVQETQVAQTETFNFTSGTGNQDILAAALANTDVFHQDSDNMNISASGADTMILEMDSLSPNFQNLNANVSVHSHVSETSSILNQPIMSPVKIPTKKNLLNKKSPLLLSTSHIPEMMIPQNIEDSLAVIGVTPPSIPTSLELPITVTNPKIAPKTTNPLTLSCGVVYQSTGLINNTIVSPSVVSSEVETSIPRVSHNPIQELDVSKNSEFLLATIPVRREEKKSNVMRQGTSMPSLDDVNEDQPKTYSPISMPLLTDPDEEIMCTIEEEAPIPDVVPIAEESPFANSAPSEDTAVKNVDLEVDNAFMEIPHQPENESVSQDTEMETENEASSQEVTIESQCETISQEAKMETENETPTQEFTIESESETISQDKIIDPENETISQETVMEAEVENMSQEVTIEPVVESTSENNKMELEVDTFSQEQVIEQELEATTQEVITEQEYEATSQDAVIEQEYEDISQGITMELEDETRSQEASVEHNPETVIQEIITGGELEASSQEDIVEQELEVTCQEAIVEQEYETSSQESSLEKEPEPTSQETATEQECEVTTEEAIIEPTSQDVVSETENSQNSAYNPDDTTNSKLDEDFDLDSEIQPSSVPSETCESLENPNSPYAVLNMVNNADNNILTDMNCDLIENSTMEIVPSTPEPLVESDASSECSSEIPLQPSISVSENQIQNLTIDNGSSDENGKRHIDEEDLTNGSKTPPDSPRSKYDGR